MNCFKTNIYDALMKTKFDIVDKHSNKQKKLQLKIQNKLDTLKDLEWEK